MMDSYAQNHEDVLLERAFRNVERGFYVDVGANDPQNDSVTNYFYGRGWRGINVEPGAIFSRLAVARPGDANLNIALSDRDGEVDFLEYLDTPGLSGIADAQKAAEGARVVKVPVRTLKGILEEANPASIEFMSIDVEGHERQVILGNDWKRFRPRVLIVEATLPRTNTPCHHGWEPLLLDAGYVFVLFDGVNRFYVRREDAALAVHFGAPVNALDRFRPHTPYIRGLETQMEELRDRNEFLDRRLNELIGEINGFPVLRLGLGLKRRISRRIRGERAAA